MNGSAPPTRAFKACFVGIGGLYVLLASSMLVRGVAVLRDFAVPESLLVEPVFEDFFLFFYELMAVIGVLMAVLGAVVRDRKGQVLASLVLCVFNLFAMWRDVGTSDSPLGNHLYKGSATLVFVFIDLALALVFASVAWAGTRQTATADGPG